MHLGTLLAAEKLVQPEQLDEALARQREAGGELEQHLLALGAVDPEQLRAVLAKRPQRPNSIEETGLGLSVLLGLALKSMYLSGSDSAAALVNELKLSPSIVQRLVDLLRERLLIEPLGSAARPDRPLDLHFVLSDTGRARAAEAVEQSEYVGPAPVPLAAFEQQVKKQSLTREQIDRETLTAGLSDLLVSRSLVDRVGTAFNAGQPILMYGPPGNGKSSISHAAARCFRQLIYLPRCIEVDGQVIKVFDPTIHEEVSLAPERSAGPSVVKHGVEDTRWVCCRRPTLSTGVELTLDMLDLNFHPRAHYYDAPLQMKASGGLLFVNDFGRQILRPIDILNRWIVPLEHGRDYLTLETGRKFSYAFDVLLIFSTNLPLKSVTEADILRRIPYRIAVGPPSREEFAHLLQRECAAHQVDLPAETLAYLIDDLYVARKRRFARYHPRFIIEHVIASAKYHRQPPRLSREILAEAMEDLFTEA